MRPAARVLALCCTPELHLVARQVLERVSHSTLRCPNIDMYSAASEGNSGSNTLLINLPPYSSEEPGKRELDDWLDTSRAALIRSGYGPAMRNAIPAGLISLQQQSTVE